MSRSNVQKKNEKPAFLLLPPKDKRGREAWWLSVKGTARLKAKNYKALLSLWVERGCRAWLSGNEVDGKEWRGEFVRDLNEGQKRWEKIILQGKKRLTWSKWEDVQWWVIEAKGDPLMFLNLAGVPPLDVLGVLELWKKHIDIQQRVWKRFRQKINKKRDIELLRMAATVLDIYEPCLTDYIKIINGLEGKDDLIPTLRNPTLPPKNELPIPKEYPKGDGLRAIAELIRNSQTFNLIPPSWEDKKGPLKAGFPHLVKDLTRIVQRELGDKWELSWGAITALLMAAFPEWFKREKNPIRNVKNAYKAKIIRLHRRIGVKREVGSETGGEIVHMSRESELK